ncbi:hypothetical protein OHC33_007651 [Knufia fluminis]|uniref:GPI-anchored cell surface glycoprotein n=1 Tax=Knufia fluminis TaxID=191047 RepID=A0AAN8EGW7_9EURO|nr:hypothetical protein OHC33_007651 [Knufia fluminis]
MSLNGLDSDAVVQAHHAALAEAGGWFLLKYANRDTVELLNRGTEGVSEARRAVQGYEEKSPVYGLVQYRRKKIILKYVPEGTSRLLQVRLAVQFQSILDTFTQHDTVFSFTTAEELSESALGLDTMLQSTGSKTSSSTSLRQQRLKEITEDNEEGATTEKTSAAQAASPIAATDAVAEPSQEVYGLPASAVRAKALRAKHKQEHSQLVTTPSIEQGTVSSVAQPEETITERPTEQLIAPPTSSQSFPVRSASINADNNLPVPPPEKSSPLPAPKNDVAIPRPSIDFSLPPLESDSDDDIRRPVPKQYSSVRYSSHLSAAESTNISKWSDEVLASTRSKQKRAPRPHGDIQGRPKTSGNNEDGGPARRVANLPTSVRVSSRSSGQPSRPGSRQSTRSVPARFVPASNLPPPLPSPTFPAVSAQRPSQSRPPRSQGSSLVNDNPTVTPEKMRLMKALQMRKRNHLLTQRSASAAATSTSPNPLTSIDSSKSVLSDLSTAPSSRYTEKRDSPSPLPELVSINESQTTSPTSIITASDNRSTKPSSLAENSISYASQTSLSSDTRSSTTPKADTEKGHEQRTEEDHPVDSAPAHMTEPEAVPVRSASAFTETPRQLLNENASNTHDVGDEYTQGSHVQQDLELSENSHGSAAFDNMPSATRVKKRYQFEGTITIPASSVEASDQSDDDSFMEELQNATVHEARPMAVNRTPVTPVLSRAPTKDVRDLTPVERAISKSRSSSRGSQVSMLDRRRTASRAGSIRSLSTALPQWPPTPTEPVPTLPKTKPAMSGNISKRIKTFEGLSQCETSTGSLPVTKDHSEKSLGLSNMFKRASFMPQSNRGDSMPEKASIRTLPPSHGAELEDTGTKTDSRPLVQRPGTNTEVYAPIHKGETVSVTARIVRDTMKPKSAHGTSDTRDLHRSPLIVEHETSSNELRPPLPRELTTQSMGSLATSPKADRRRFSFTSHRSGGKSLSPTEARSYRMSFAGHQKKSSKSPSETSSITDEKRASRTSRMLKRLSGMGKSRNRDSAMLTSPTQETLHPDTIEEQVERSEPSIRHVVDIGEVNVQFPETLLWKRRFLRVDDEGYLIFAPPSNDFSTRGRSRKIHLDELHRPTLPDLEREEMAWSIMLDMKAGGTFQCACESKPAQSNFLKMLLDAHNAYHQLYTS